MKMETGMRTRMRLDIAAGGREDGDGTGLRVQMGTAARVRVEMKLVMGQG